jgi:hypothetical protein
MFSREKVSREPPSPALHPSYSLLDVTHIQVSMTGVRQWHGKRRPACWTTAYEEQWPFETDCAVHTLHAMTPQQHVLAQQRIAGTEETGRLVHISTVLVFSRCTGRGVAHTYGTWTYLGTMRTLLHILVVCSGILRTSGISTQGARIHMAR